MLVANHLQRLSINLLQNIENIPSWSRRNPSRFLLTTKTNRVGNTTSCARTKARLSPIYTGLQVSFEEPTKMANVRSESEARVAPKSTLSVCYRGVSDHAAYIKRSIKNILR